MKNKSKARATAFFMIIAASMVIFACTHVNSIGWTSTEVVSTESTGNSYDPSLGVGSDGTVHITWTDDTDYDGSGTDDDILYKSLDVNVFGTVDDYDGQWHSTDFTITLTATDDSGEVAETYYKINDGPTMSVSADGQPYITTEGANNKLEYWSVNNAGNEEFPHKVLTGIKLDKTAPTGSVEIDEGAATTDDPIVDLTLSAQDPESGPDEMRFSNDGLSWSNWESYSTWKSWTLTAGDGTKTVYVQFKNRAGLDSSIISETITLEDGLESSSISISLSSNDLRPWETTSINGWLSPGMKGASIVIQGRPIGGAWTAVTTILTKSYGEYSYVWSPAIVGTWEVKATWSGAEGYPPCESPTRIVSVKATGAESSSISISLSESSVTVGESVTVSGSLSPVHEGDSVAIRYGQSEDSWNTLSVVSTNSNGEYSYVWSPTTTGTWDVYAIWGGDETLLPSESPIQSITVEAATDGDGAGFPWLYLIAGVIVVAIVLIAVFLFLRRRNP